MTAATARQFEPDKIVIDEWATSYATGFPRALGVGYRWGECRRQTGTSDSESNRIVLGMQKLNLWYMR